MLGFHPYLQGCNCKVPPLHENSSLWWVSFRQETAGGEKI